MATHPEIVREMTTKKPETAAPARPAATQPERRGNRRCRITQLMRIRPSDPEKTHFEDLRGSMSVSRSGVYFQSSEPGYEVGLRLFEIGRASCRERVWMSGGCGVGERWQGEWSART